jgi:hypothetical protein
MVRVRLVWQAGEEPLADFRPALRLEQGGAVLAEAAGAPAQGRYPTSGWSPREVVSEVRDLRVPAGAEGAADVVVVLGDRRHVLGQVTVSGAGVQMTPPRPQSPAEAVFGDIARLVGYDAPQDVVSGEAVPVTLYWQSMTDGPMVNYTVFVHLIAADGRLVAQHDSPPAGGTRPTGEWLSGEYITDAHNLVWREPAAGPARLSVGLYDPATGERLRLADGADSFTLPSPVTIRPSE